MQILSISIFKYEIIIYMDYKSICSYIQEIRIANPNWRRAL